MAEKSSPRAWLELMTARSVGQVLTHRATEAPYLAVGYDA